MRNLTMIFQINFNEEKSIKFTIKKKINVSFYQKKQGRKKLEKNTNQNQ
jgi:hypothetical protein